MLGLAVTDSPASSGTTRLRFSRVQGQYTELECSALEEWDLTPFYSQNAEFSKFFAMCRSFFNREQPNETNQPQSEDEEPMKQEQFDQMMGAINGIATKQNELESKFNTFSAQKPETKGEEPEGDGKDKETNGMTPEQFSKLTETLDSIAQKQADLETKFTQLSQTGPDGQGADKSGGGEGYMPV